MCDLSIGCFQEPRRWSRGAGESLRWYFRGGSGIIWGSLEGYLGKLCKVTLFNGGENWWVGL